MLLAAVCIFARSDVKCAMNHSRLHLPEHRTKMLRAGTIAAGLFPCISIAAAVTLLLTSCSEKSDSARNAKPAAAEQYVLGTPLNFGTTGNARPYQVSGWSAPEPGHTWTDNSVATLRFDVKSSGTSLILRMRMSALTKAPELPSQPVEVKVNGVHVADWEVAAESDYSTPIPAETAGKDNPMTIQFTIPKATSPTKLGMGQDDRTLGLNVAQLTLSAASQ